jgi:hypothetical protein
MEITVNIKEVEWWFWAITLIFMATALLGWSPGYYVVIALSGIQIVYFTQNEGSLKAFPTQVRIAYFAITLFGLWESIRFPVYVLLLVGTIMVTFTGRCVLALALKLLPWNRNVAPGASCEISSEKQ